MTGIFRKWIFKSFSDLNNHWLTNSCLICSSLRLMTENNFESKNVGSERKNSMNYELSRHRIVSSDLLADKQLFRDDEYRKYAEPRKKRKTFKCKGEILFGIHPVYLALLQKKRIFYKLYVRKEEDSLSKSATTTREEIIKIARISSVPISYLNSKDFKELYYDSVHQGICLDAGYLPVAVWNENEFCSETDKVPLWVVLDGILDPMNTGAITRSAYYFGVNKLFVTRGNSCRLSPVVSKASSGALEIMDIFSVDNLYCFLQARKEDGWQIVSTVAYCENKLESAQKVISAKLFNLTKPTIIIFGNEGKGVSESVQNLCDCFISIEPVEDLHTGIDSLNVSVAAGIILHSLSNSKSVKR